LLVWARDEPVQRGDRQKLTQQGHDEREEDCGKSEKGIGATRPRLSQPAKERGVVPEKRKKKKYTEFGGGTGGVWLGWGASRREKKNSTRQTWVKPHKQEKQKRGKCKREHSWFCVQGPEKKRAGEVF